MLAAINQTEDLIASLRDEFDDLDWASDDDAMLMNHVKSAMRKGVGAVSALAQARQEIEDLMVRLDAVEQEVALSVNPKIDDIYTRSRKYMNGNRNYFDHLYEEYYDTQGYSVTVVPTTTESLDAFNRFSLASVRSTGAVNAILISGILGSLMLSRHQVISHGSAILGFFIGATLMLVLQLLLIATGAADTNGNDRVLRHPDPR